MHHFIQRNKKKLLAVFGVLLMVVFIIPTTFKNQSDRDNIVIGKIGDQKVTAEDEHRAKQDIQMLDRLLLGLLMRDMQARNSGNGDLMQMWSILQHCKEKPLAYVLLQKEAAASGVEAPDAEVDELMQRLGASGGGRDDQELKDALKRLLAVDLNYNRISGTVKVTLPELLAKVAEVQEPTLNIVEFKAEDFLVGAAEPKPEMIEATWKQWATVPPDAASSAASPVRFGYLVPEKVKLQYLRLPDERFREAAFRSLSNNDLRAVDFVGVIYYSKHPAEFTAKATEDRDPLKRPATRSATAPGTKPYREIQDELRWRVLFDEMFQTPPDAADYAPGVEQVRQKVTMLANQLRAKVIERMTADYKANLKGEPIYLEPVPTAAKSATQPATSPAMASAATEPATAPARIPAPPLESVAYMEAVLQNVLDVAMAGQSAPKTPLEQPKTPQEQSASILVDMPQPLARARESRWYNKSDLLQLRELSSTVAGNDGFVDVVLRTGPEKPATNPATTAPSTAPAATAPTDPATAPTTTSPSATGPTTEASTQPATTQAVSFPGPTVGPASHSAWEMYQPLPILQSRDGDSYIVRLTGYEPRRVPPLDEVRDKVISDLKLMQAVKDARAKAESIYQEVAKRKDNPNSGLAHVADMTGNKVISAGPIPSRAFEIPGYPDLTDSRSIGDLASAAASLMRKVTTKEQHPFGIIDLPTARRTLVAEVRSVTRGWTQEQDYARQRQFLQTLQAEAETDVMHARPRGLPPMMQQPDPNVRSLSDIWFNPDEITKRTGYAPTGRGG
jgi:hypothetical protein